MKVEKTIEEVLNFGNIANSYIGKLPEGKETKFSYAIRKVAKKVKDSFDYYNDELFNIDVNNCATDEKGNILKDERGNFTYSKEGLKNKREELKALLKHKVSFDNYIATEIPEDLTEVEMTSFLDFVSDRVFVEQEPA